MTDILRAIGKRPYVGTRATSIPCKGGDKIRPKPVRER